MPNERRRFTIVYAPITKQHLVDARAQMGAAPPVQVPQVDIDHASPHEHHRRALSSSAPQPAFEGKLGD